MVVNLVQKIEVRQANSHQKDVAEVGTLVLVKNKEQNNGLNHHESE